MWSQWNHRIGKLISPSLFLQQVHSAERRTIATAHITNYLNKKSKSARGTTLRKSKHVIFPGGIRDRHAMFFWPPVRKWKHPRNQQIQCQPNGLRQPTCIPDSPSCSELAILQSTWTHSTSINTPTSHTVNIPQNPQTPEPNHLANSTRVLP